MSASLPEWIWSRCNTMFISTTHAFAAVLTSVSWDSHKLVNRYWRKIWVIHISINIILTIREERRRREEGKKKKGELINTGEWTAPPFLRLYMAYEASACITTVPGTSWISGSSGSPVTRKYFKPSVILPLGVLGIFAIQNVNHDYLDHSSIADWMAKVVDFKVMGVSLMVSEPANPKSSCIMTKFFILRYVVSANCQYVDQRSSVKSKHQKSRTCRVQLSLQQDTLSTEAMSHPTTPQIPRKHVNDGDV